VNGYSNNTRLKNFDLNWEFLGYQPQDNTEDHVEMLRAKGVDVDGPWEWPEHGGSHARSPETASQVIKRLAPPAPRMANFANYDPVKPPMPTRNINLTERLDRFVETSVSAVRYQNASEVVRDALRLLEQRNEECALRLELLRAAVNEGEAALARGEYEDVVPGDIGDFVAVLGSHRT
jgi:antitoxin ParD1/3/4